MELIDSQDSQLTMPSWTIIFVNDDGIFQYRILKKFPYLAISYIIAVYQPIHMLVPINAWKEAMNSDCVSA